MICSRGYNPRVMGLCRHFRQEVEARLAEQLHTLALTTAQRYALQELQALINEIRNPDLQGQISLMSEVFSRPQFQAVCQELNGLRTRKVTGRALLNALGKIYVRYNLKSHFERIIHDDVPVPVIVCSEGLME